MTSDFGQLRPYERHTACFLVALLVGIGVHVVIEQYHICTEPADPLSIHVVGAVQESHLLLPHGSTLDDVISRVALTTEADCNELDGSRHVVNGETVIIPHSGKTTVYVTGAVHEPKLVVLDNKAKPKEVLQSVDLQDDADVSAFMRRRSLKNGSVIEIKRKNKKERPAAAQTKHIQSELFETPK